MGSYDDLRGVIKHITEVTGDDSAWKQGLTPQQVRDVNGWLVSDGSGYKGFTDQETGVHYEDRSHRNTDKTPAVPDDALDRIRGQHPGLFDPTTKAATAPPPANQQGNAGGNNGGAPPPAGAPAPVPTEEQNKGEAAKAAKTLEDKLQDRNNKATDADRELAQAVLNAHATTAEGAKRLNDIQAEISSAVNSATALDTPMGAREFSKFLNSKLAEISDVVKTASLDAESQKAVLTALAEFYGTRTTDNGKGGDEGKEGEKKNENGQGGGGQGGAGGDGGGSGGGDLGDLGGDLGLGGDPLLDGAGGGGDPLAGLAESAAPALQSGLGAASQIPGQLAAIPGQIAGAGSSIPGMFGNGTGRGGEITDPFKTDKKPGEGKDPFDPAGDAELAGLFGNEPLPEGDNDNKDDDDKDGGKDDKDGKDDKNEPKPGEPVANPNAPGALPTNGPTSVTINGVVYTADNPKLAAAVTDISKGTPPLEAFRKHDIAIPPPTSPPATPLDPGQLRFGSYGTYTNGDIVVALDKQRALIDGQVQPISSAAAKPGFAGWQNPPAPTGAPTVVAPAAPATPATPAAPQNPFAPITQTSAQANK